MSQDLTPIWALADKLERSKAHTYASENADHYRGFDEGQRDAGRRLKALLRAHADACNPNSSVVLDILGVPAKEKR